MKIGRPRKFQSVEELQALVDDFFATTPEDEQTITGLALHLGTFRKVLMEYEKGLFDDFFDKEVNFSNSVRAAKDRIANGYEKRCIKRGNAGDIFALKNFGWTDRTEIEQNIKGDISLSQILTEAQNRKKLTSGEEDEE